MDRNTQEDIKAHLIATNEEFRQLAAQHRDFDTRIEVLEARPFLSEQEKLEEIRLKKQKLRLKDQMEAMLSAYKANGRRVA